jgi:TolB-like protein/class 3 adenylate cyclase/lipoprotein NlpI
LPQSRQLAAIMFTDIVGYTALMGDDEKKAFELLRKNRRIQQPIIKQFNGTWIKELGDGVLASFHTVTDAVLCAITIQQVCCDIPDLKLRIGIHLGDVVFEHNDVFGDGVNIASRLQALAPIGGIWVSEPVYNNVANKKEIIGRFVKEEKLKNVKESVKVYEIDLQNSPSPKMPSITQSNSYRAPATFKKNSSTNRKTAFIFIGAVIIIFSAYLLYHLFYKIDKEITSSGDVKVIDKSIAVLPFVNMSNDKNQEYFSDGLSEELINLLAKIPELKVIGRTSSFSFKGKNEDLRSIAKKLGVAQLLEGSVRKNGNRIRVSAQLIKATDGSHLWSETYDRDLEDIFKLHEEIAGMVVSQLKLKLLAVSSEKAPVNIEVHSLILKGKFFHNKLDKENVAKAVDFYEQAIALDSSNALAWALAGAGYVRQAYQKYIDQGEGYEKARKAAMKAIALNENIAAGYLTLGDIKMKYDADWKGAQAAFEKALNLEPSNPDVVNLNGVLNQVTGSLNKAIELTTQALALDPLRPVFYNNQGTNLTYAKRFEEANVFYKKTLEIDPRFQRSHMYIGRNYMLQGKKDLALAEMQQENVEVFKVFGLSLIYHALGRRKEADATLNDFLLRYQNEWPYLIAELYAFRGEKDASFEWLGKAYSRKDSWLLFLKGDPLLKNLWLDPRYKALLNKRNLPLD